jgi:MFS family permease
MTPESTPLIPTGGSGRTVQDYIDETPVWADATPVRHPPITNMQWFIWWLAAAGKFFEGMVVFTTGVALPLMAKEFALGATEKGVVAAASLFGILIGAATLGGFADRYGRKQMFIVEMVLFGVFTVLLTLSPSYPLVVAALVGIGVALGCDYPTAHLIISESIPSRIRGRMVLGAFGFQAVGALVGPRPHHPRFGAVVSAGPRHLRHRNFHPHHPCHRHRRQHRTPAQRRRTHSERHPGHQRCGVHRRAVDRGDRLCRAAGRPRGPHSPSNPRLHRLRGRLAAGSAVSGTLSGALLFVGFMLFSFMTNIGPNAMTYLIAGEVFPTSIRGTGAGFAASFAKIGAVLTAFLFPILLKDIGTDLLLLILVATSLVGALVTWSYAIETKGISLEKIEEKGIAPKRNE